MIKHIALFTLKAEYGGQAKEENARRIKENVDGLRRDIPGILRIEAAGPLFSPKAVYPQYDLAVYSEFDSVADYEAYFNHPAHRAAAAFAGAVSEKVAGITYEA